MIRHTVAFRLVHPEGSPEEQAFLTEGPALLRAIPGVEDFVVSRQVGAKSTLRFQFAMTFADQAAYDAYDAHPDHRRFVETRWAGEVAEFAELDLVPYP
ncbi:Dabb family protein [Microlunatus flavus]|uniref:Stress responsive A/B Barrel Domain n=1 Tax=Microlunatus flavus TaxID=1036181 RepID=A0A1H9CJV1_9ACTN|nr:Dabb family protein [Microlunatus flavus]SEQ01439.1 Stress responsive A/B Barrel Domain [Microlunatus flavus]